MVRQCVDSLLGTVLLTALLPFLFLSQLCEFLKSSPARKTREFAPGLGSSQARVVAIGEFDFNRSIEAYEGLLDEMIEESSR